MKAVDKISRIVEVINFSRELSNEDFNHNPEVIDVYKMIHGEEKLQSVLERKTDLHLNKFYSLTLQIEKIAKAEEISITELNEQLNRIEEIYPRYWQLINLIELAINRDELEVAEQIINQLPNDDKGPSQYIGHRKMLKHFAEQGNLVEFKKRIKICKTGKFPRNEIGELKFKMIQTYSEQNGIREGIELCKTKLFGEKFTQAAILWKASLMTLDKIDTILNEISILTEANPNIKAELYTKHFFDRRLTEITETEFSKVTNEIIKIDPKLKKGDGKLRDYLFFELGSSTGNRIQIMNCKKNIKSTFYKKELNYHIKNVKEGNTMGNKL